MNQDQRAGELVKLRAELTALHDAWLESRRMSLLTEEQFKILTNIQGPLTSLIAGPILVSEEITAAAKQLWELSGDGSRSLQDAMANQRTYQDVLLREHAAKRLKFKTLAQKCEHTVFDGSVSAMKNGVCRVCRDVVKLS